LQPDLWKYFKLHENLYLAYLIDLVQLLFLQFFFAYC
jgi:hypothetical protein